MKKVALLVVGLVLFSIPLFAGEYLMNDTGETVYGLRVVFSEPVTLASFGDMLTVVAPPGKSTEFMFSGGILEEWAGHWFNWEPGSALLTNHQWFTDPATVEIAASDWAAYEASRPFWERNPNPTYEEIMAEIAKYPGPEEPLYEPAPDEAIWLTDLKGHADIYDNDSIKINYADSFNQSQITKIEVYRNGIKMEFLPDKIDVLTNEQMKTFDGNPLENTPASTHTDHAIFGYEYEVKFIGASQVVRPVIVRSSVHYSPQYLWFYIENNWYWDIEHFHLSDTDILAFLVDMKTRGFKGASLGVTYFIDGKNKNTIFPHYVMDPTIHRWSRTATDEEVRSVLRLIREAGLDAHLRLDILMTERGAGKEGTLRHEIEPTNIDLFFTNYGNIAAHYARLAEECHVEVYCPIVEMNSLDRYSAHIKELLSRLDTLFSGRFAVNASIHHYLNGFNCYSNETRFEENIGKYYDWFDETGRPLLVEMSCWEPQIETQSDQRFTHLAAGMINNWSSAVAYFRNNYPTNPCGFGEIGAYNWDGHGMGFSSTHGGSNVLQDNQEFADTWAAYLLSARAMGLDILSVWTIPLCNTYLLAVGTAKINASTSPVINILNAILSY